MTIAKMDRAAANALRAEIEAAAQAIAQKHGLDGLVKGCSYDGESTITFKIEMAIVGANGVAQTHEAADFERYAREFGVADHVRLGSTFVSRGRVHTVVGLHARGRKLPVLARDPDGGTFKFAVDAVNRLVVAS
ncbi:MAG: hypothetical protein ACKVU1_02660 [bacterium]